MWNPRMSLVGMGKGTTALENRVAVPQKAGRRTAVERSNSTPGYVLEN